MKVIKNENHHYFASNAFEWRTSSNLEELINTFKKQKVAFNLFYVPLPESAHYKINFYTPQVEGIILLEQYTLKRTK